MVYWAEVCRPGATEIAISPRIIPLIALGAVLAVGAAVALVLLSVLDEEPAGLEAYYKEFAVLDTELARQQQQLQQERQDALSDTGEEAVAVGRFLDSLDRGLEFYQTYVQGVEELEPPSEVAAAHAEAVSALDEFILVFADVRDEVQELDTFAAMEGTFNRQDFAAATERVNNACAALTQIATDNELTTTLSCGG